LNRADVNGTKNEDHKWYCKYHTSSFCKDHWQEKQQTYHTYEKLCVQTNWSTYRPSEVTYFYIKPEANRGFPEAQLELILIKLGL